MPLLADRDKDWNNNRQQLFKLLLTAIEHNIPVDYKEKGISKTKLITKDNVAGIQEAMKSKNGTFILTNSEKNKLRSDWIYKDGAWTEEAEFLSNNKPTTTRSTTKNKITVPINEQGFPTSTSHGKSGNTVATYTTSAQESCTAAYVTLMANGVKPFKSFDIDDIKKALQKTQGTESIEYILEYLDIEWFESCWTLASAIVPFVNSTYTIHRDSKIVNKINSSAIKACTNTGIPLTALSKDKWNPADIWAIKNNFNAEDIIDDSIYVMNEYLMMSINDKNIIPFSLKKPSGRRANTKKYNFEKKTHAHKFTDFSITSSKSKNPFDKSSGLNIIYEEGHFSIHYSKSKGLIGGEITLNGGSARAGSVGSEHIKRECYEGLDIRIESKTVIEMRAKNIRENPTGNEAKKIYSFVKEWVENSYTEDQFVNDIMLADEETCIRNLCIFQLINFIPKNKRDEWITRAVIFAESKSDWSGPYIKVY